ncbi:MAG: glycosyltransferase family 9 protein [Gemmatimonadetes bacterium]|jgi:heptosyltransferase I|nr:glycosyltransferase family 9 protein [Gemmatimonadota bacterium]MBP9106810.1 glycosyltransferase family 9 protein [Gemmatimonadaceae bacterium]MBK7834973.1 glycosyltransferase family 9 protein [Gemmatimonadota bacterium]MBK8061387.1 glycosyltransferase family 9 protein [Gemmatimonadota bacterium]MBK8645029.1 glycosyltransferase family 9 protein [Gemmatimonadota bacterium]
MIDARLDRVGIVMMSAVGDAVHVLPVINAIKRRQADAHITWVLQPGPATLVRGHRSVDEIVIFDRSRGRRAFIDVKRELSQRPFDLVLNLQVYFKAGLVTSFTRAPVKLGFDKPRARDLNWLFTTHRIPSFPVGQHVQDQYFEFLTALGIPYEPVVWDLGPTEAERAWQREFFAPIDRPTAAIVVATSKPEKDWLPERWAQVIDVLYADYGLQPVLVGGRSERELAAEAVIMAKARHRPISALGSGLRKLVSILDGSALVLAPDTGPLHITVALQRPVISLMGYTNPKRTGPYRAYHDLLIDAYGNPGEDYPISMENRQGRMPLITVDDVLTKVEHWQRTYALGRAQP